jgi:hypothetical protein
MTDRLAYPTETPAMADITDFADQAASFFGVLQESFATQPGLRRLGLPLSGETVEAFVKAAYYASLIPDEGRWPAASLICYPPGTSLQFHLLFDEPLPVSAAEIAKLSHSIDNRSHIACDVHEKQIRLAGIHVNQLATRRENGFGPGMHINSLKVTIVGPGHIEATTDVITLVYRGGEILKHAPLSRSKIVGRMVERIKTELDNDAESPAYSLAAVFTELMRAIARLGHGGMVILAKNPKATQFSSLRRTNCIFLQQLLVTYSQNMGHLVEAVGGVDGLTEPANASRFPDLRMNVAAATDRLENCIEAVANFAGLDGAIVLTFGCNVGAFNAIIDRQTKPGSVKLVDPEGNAIDYRQAFSHRGSRHQSGLLYAQSVPDSFVFVISQDGSVSVFHNPNDGTVTCEFGLRPTA